MWVQETPNEAAQGPLGGSHRGEAGGGLTGPPAQTFVESRPQQGRLAWRDLPVGDEVFDSPHWEEDLQAAGHGVVGSGAVEVAAHRPGPCGGCQAVAQSSAEGGCQAELRLLGQQRKLGVEVPRQLGAEILDQRPCGGGDRPDHHSGGFARAVPSRGADPDEAVPECPTEGEQAGGGAEEGAEEGSVGVVVVHGLGQLSPQASASALGVDHDAHAAHHGQASGCGSTAVADQGIGQRVATDSMATGGERGTGGGVEGTLVCGQAGGDHGVVLEEHVDGDIGRVEQTVEVTGGASVVSVTEQAEDPGQQGLVASQRVTVEDRVAAGATAPGGREGGIEDQNLVEAGLEWVGRIPADGCGQAVSMERSWPVCQPVQEAEDEATAAALVAEGGGGEDEVGGWVAGDEALQGGHGQAGCFVDGDDAASRGSVEQGAEGGERGGTEAQGLGDVDQAPRRDRHWNGWVDAAEGEAEGCRLAAAASGEDHVESGLLLGECKGELLDQGGLFGGAVGLSRGRRQGLGVRTRWAQPGRDAVPEARAHLRGCVGRHGQACGPLGWRGAHPNHQGTASTDEAVGCGEQIGVDAVVEVENHGVVGAPEMGAESARARVLVARPEHLVGRQAGHQGLGVGPGLGWCALDEAADAGVGWSGQEGVLAVGAHDKRPSS